MAAPFNFGMARSSKTTSGLSSNGFLDGIDTIDCFTANVQIGTSLYQITNDAANRSLSSTIRMFLAEGIPDLIVYGS